MTDKPTPPSTPRTPKSLGAAGRRPSLGARMTSAILAPVSTPPSASSSSSSSSPSSTPSSRSSANVLAEAQRLTSGQSSASEMRYRAFVSRHPPVRPRNKKFTPSTRKTTSAPAPSNQSSKSNQGKESKPSPPVPLSSRPVKPEPEPEWGYEGEMDVTEDDDDVVLTLRSDVDEQLEIEKQIEKERSRPGKRKIVSEEKEGEEKKRSSKIKTEYEEKSKPIINQLAPCTGDSVIMQSFWDDQKASTLGDLLFPIPIKYDSKSWDWDKMLDATIDANTHDNEVRWKNYIDKMPLQERQKFILPSVFPRYMATPPVCLSENSLTIALVPFIFQRDSSFKFPTSGNKQIRILKGADPESGDIKTTNLSSVEFVYSQHVQQAIIQRWVHPNHQKDPRLLKWLFDDCVACPYLSPRLATSFTSSVSLSTLIQQAREQWHKHVQEYITPETVVQSKNIIDDADQGKPQRYPKDVIDQNTQMYQQLDQDLKQLTELENEQGVRDLHQTLFELSRTISQYKLFQVDEHSPISDDHPDVTLPQAFGWFAESERRVYETKAKKMRQEKKFMFDSASSHLAVAPNQTIHVMPLRHVAFILNQALTNGWINPTFINQVIDFQDYLNRRVNQGWPLSFGFNRYLYNFEQFTQVCFSYRSPHTRYVYLPERAALFDKDILPPPNDPSIDPVRFIKQTYLSKPFQNMLELIRVPPLVPVADALADTQINDMILEKVREEKAQRDQKEKERKEQLDKELQKRREQAAQAAKEKAQREKDDAKRKEDLARDRQKALEAKAEQDAIDAVAAFQEQEKLKAERDRKNKELEELKKKQDQERAAKEEHERKQREAEALAAQERQKQAEIAKDRAERKHYTDLFSAEFKQLQTALKTHKQKLELASRNIQTELAKVERKGLEDSSRWIVNLNLNLEAKYATDLYIGRVNRKPLTYELGEEEWKHVIARYQDSLVQYYLKNPQDPVAQALCLQRHRLVCHRPAFKDTYLATDALYHLKQLFREAKTDKDNVVRKHIYQTSGETIDLIPVGVNFRGRVPDDPAFIKAQILQERKERKESKEYKITDNDIFQWRLGKAKEQLLKFHRDYETQRDKLEVEAIRLMNNPNVREFGHWAVLILYKQEMLYWDPLFPADANKYEWGYIADIITWRDDYLLDVARDWAETVDGKAYIQQFNENAKKKHEQDQNEAKNALLDKYRKAQQGAREQKNVQAIQAQLKKDLSDIQNKKVELFDIHNHVLAFKVHPSKLQMDGWSCGYLSTWFLTQYFEHQVIQQMLPILSPKYKEMYVPNLKFMELTRDKYRDDQTIVMIHSGLLTQAQGSSTYYIPNMMTTCNQKVFDVLNAIGTPTIQKQRQHNYKAYIEQLVRYLTGLPGLPEFSESASTTTTTSTSGSGSKTS